MTKVVTIGTALLALLLAACGGSESYSEAPETAVAAHTAVPTATAAPAKTAKNRPDADGDGVPDAVTLKGRLGDTLTLEGAGLNGGADHTKSKIRVTVHG